MFVEGLVKVMPNEYEPVILPVSVSIEPIGTGGALME